MDTLEDLRVDNNDLSNLDIIKNMFNNYGMGKIENLDLSRNYFDYISLYSRNLKRVDLRGNCTLKFADASNESGNAKVLTGCKSPMIS